MYQTKPAMSTCQATFRAKFSHQMRRKCSYAARFGRFGAKTGPQRTLFRNL